MKKVEFLVGGENRLLGELKEGDVRDLDTAFADKLIKRKVAKEVKETKKVGGSKKEAVNVGE